MIELHLNDEALDTLAGALAERLLPLLGARASTEDVWMTTKEAAVYLGISVNALHKLTGERSIPFSQDAPAGKCFFKRSELDAWRGRPT